MLLFLFLLLLLQLVLLKFLQQSVQLDPLALETSRGDLREIDEVEQLIFDRYLLVLLQLILGPAASRPCFYSLKFNYKYNRDRYDTGDQHLGL